MAKAVITNEMVDELVTVRDQLRALAAREETLKKAFKEAGAGVYSSYAHQVEIKFTTRKTLDMDAARAALGAEFCEKNVKVGEAMNITTMVLARTVV